MNYLVETKIEYTSQLINLLYPFIYDGIQSLYDEAIKVAPDNEELKIFQNFLKKIPSWPPLMLEMEVSRILKESECYDLLPQLLNAVIKSNIMVLTNTLPEKKHTIKLPKDINFQGFIHHAYIETAKNIYNNPYLFYHKYSLYDIKKNQRDAFDSIKNAIIESIRKILPLQYILKEYLGSDKNTQSVDLDGTMSEQNKIILDKLIKSDLPTKLQDNKQDNNEDNNDSNINRQINKLKVMLQNDPLDSANNSEQINTKIIKSEKNPPYVLKKVINPVIVNEINNPVINSVKNPVIVNEINNDNDDTSESIQATEKTNKMDNDSVSYYRNTNSKIIDSFTNKSNMRSLFYSNEPQIKSIETADVNNYLKHEASMKFSDDSNINSIKNMKTDKFKNKYYQV